jgi:hypothetical protein
VTIGCGQGGSCCGACEAAARNAVLAPPTFLLTPPIRLDGLGARTGLGDAAPLNTAAAALDAVIPGAGTAMKTFILSEVKPLPPITVDDQQMFRVVDQLAQQGVYVPTSISGLPEDPSIFAAFGPQHKTLVMGAAAGLALLFVLKR